MLSQEEMYEIIELAKLGQRIKIEKVNAKNKLGETPLLFAMRFFKIDSVKTLLESRADVRAAGGNWNFTPLHCAVRLEFGGVQLVKDLCTRGADLNAVSADGYTPLMWGVENNNKNTVLELLSLKADVNAVTLQERTALLVAEQSSVHRDLIEALVLYGANLDELYLAKWLKDMGKCPFIEIIQMFMFDTGIDGKTGDELVKCFKVNPMSSPVLHLILAYHFPAFSKPEHLAQDIACVARDLEERARALRAAPTPPVSAAAAAAAAAVATDSAALEHKGKAEVRAVLGVPNVPDTIVPDTDEAVVRRVWGTVDDENTEKRSFVAFAYNAYKALARSDVAAAAANAAVVPRSAGPV